MNKKIKLFNDEDSTFNDKSEFKDKLFNKEELEKLYNNNKPDFITKNTSSQTSQTEDLTRKILIVDDEPDVIAITKLALNNYKYKGNRLSILKANSYEEAVKIINKESDIALIFLDVVMKDNHGGLKLVKYIRNKQKNNITQIIIRTGQAGYAPEKEVINNYKINFYQTKADLTERKLYTLTTSSLRSYDALKELSNYSENLEKEVVLRTKELLIKNEELNKANATKNKMFSIIAHDLVNPFNSLIGFSELLKDNCRNFTIDKIEEFSKILYETAYNTYKLLSNLLEWARAQTGKIEYKPKKTNLSNLIKLNIELLHNQASKKSIKLVFNEKNDRYIYCDEDMINIVIRNIISNGIKFTKEGNVTIKTKFENDFCILNIIDTGIGINTNKINNLFSSENISTEGTAGESGTGIGLMLCKEFIDKNKGKIIVESEVNEGSTFKIYLPINKNNS